MEKIPLLFRSASNIGCEICAWMTKSMSIHLLDIEQKISVIEARVNCL